MEEGVGRPVQTPTTLAVTLAEDPQYGLPRALSAVRLEQRDPRNKVLGSCPPLRRRR